MIEMTVQTLHCRVAKQTILPKLLITTLGIIIRGSMRERERTGEFKEDRTSIVEGQLGILERERRETDGLVK